MYIYIYSSTYVHTNTYLVWIEIWRLPIKLLCEVKCRLGLGLDAGPSHIRFVEPEALQQSGQGQ